MPNFNNMYTVNTKLETIQLLFKKETYYSVKSCYPSRSCISS
jgi:hypothetical protein